MQQLRRLRLVGAGNVLKDPTARRQLRAQEEADPNPNSHQTAQDSPARLQTRKALYGAMRPSPGGVLPTSLKSQVVAQRLAVCIDVGEAWYTSEHPRQCCWLQACCL